MRLRFAIILSLILAIQTLGACYSRTAEIRGVWMDRRSIPATEQGIRELVRSYAASGINLLLPEVIYNGYSAYPSEYLTQQDLWGGVDMLGVLIDEAHAQKMEVHPWVWAFRAGYADDIGGILSKHPEWAAVAEDGSTLTPGGGYWLCPSIPEVRQLLLAAYTELARKYPIDGIHLDYVRFDSPRYCYNDSCREKFEARHGVDPLCIEPFTPTVLDWHLWREELVNSFVAQVATEAKKVRPEIQVSAAVASFPDQARLNYLQNWEHWADNKWVEFMTPMDYTPNPADFARRVESSVGRVDARALLAPGLGLYTTKEVGPMLVETEVERSTPADGVTLFAAAYLDPEHLEAFREGPFAESAILPSRNPIEGAQELLASADRRLSEETGQESVDLAKSEVASAGRLLEYWSYRMQSTEYVQPAPPPIFIPEVVAPLPRVEAPYASSPIRIDGKLDEPAWKSASMVCIQSTNLGAPAEHESEVLLTYDAKNVYIAFRAYDLHPNRPARVRQHDGPVFEDDSVEALLQFGSGDYYHFALNAAGTKYEAKGRDRKWDTNWEAATGIQRNAWIAEMAIPRISPSSELRADFCRNRVSRETERTCWSPTYGSYHTPIRFGTVILRALTFRKPS
ncbi:MAG: family 10 glycosylhydrolase [Armatimonadota bacterium]